jgi:hypothetical protein
MSIVLVPTFTRSRLMAAAIVSHTKTRPSAAHTLQAEKLQR